MKQILPSENETDMPLDKKKKCHAIIHSAASGAAAAGAGLAQIPLSDSAIIIPIQVTMIISLGYVFDIHISKGIAYSMVAAELAWIGGRSISQILLGWIPGLGNILNASTAFAITEGIGWYAANDFYKKNK
jgi:uncharacterized protein (DUF697 family)